jgi:hypothetical protein
MYLCTMDIEREIQVIALDVQLSKIDFVNATSKILLLCSVGIHRDVLEPVIQAILLDVELGKLDFVKSTTKILSLSKLC